MKFRGDTLVVEKALNDLDRLVLDVTGILSTCGIQYATISGYVAVLLGRSRATEDIDVIVSRFDDETADELATRLSDAGFWGPNTPLDSMHETLADELPVRIARDGEIVPNVEIMFPADKYDRASLEETITVQFDDRSLIVGSLELQIAYKLRLGARKDFEDALHLYETIEGNLNTEQLQRYVEDLGVRNAYDRLKRA